MKHDLFIFKVSFKILKISKCILLACTSYGSTDVTIVDNTKKNELCSCQMLDYLFKKIKKMLISNGYSHVINVKRELHVDNVGEYYIVS